MKNYEKYRDLIVKSNYTSDIGDDSFCNNFVEPNILKPMGKGCLDVSCVHCRMLMSVWLMDEYKEHEEPYIDWSKVPVDTKVYVKDNFNVSEKPRYFAKYENGKVYTWDYGRTSWSAESEDDIISWKYAKLDKPEKL